MCAQILALLELDENSRQVVKSLQLSGHHVVSSKNYNDAIRVLLKQSVDLIISDVHLENGGNVFDFMRWAKRNLATRGTPFVLFSSEPTVFAKHVEDGVRTTARLLGASKFISMNEFDSDDFRKQIDSLLPHSSPKLEVRAKETTD